MRVDKKTKMIYGNFYFGIFLQKRDLNKRVKTKNELQKKSRIIVRMKRDKNKNESYTHTHGT